MLSNRAAPVLKFPPIPILRYSPILILPIPQIADTFADTDTVIYNLRLVLFFIYDN